MAKVKSKINKFASSHSSKVRIYIDPIANTFNMWWGDPKKAYSSEEVDSPHSNDVIIKDKQGRPISLEVIGIFPKELNIVEHLKSKNITKKQEPYLLEAI